MHPSAALERMKAIAFNSFGLRPEELDLEANILELGLDSLMIIKLAQEIERHFGINLEARWFLVTMPSLRGLAEHVAAQLPKGDASAPGQPPASPGPDATPLPPFFSDNPPPRTSCAPHGAEDYAHLFAVQMRTMQEVFARQWQCLNPDTAVARSPLPPAVPEEVAAGRERPKRIARNYRGFVLEESPLSEEQRAFVSALLARHTTRTAGSKRLGRGAPELADWKSTLSYRSLLREAAYPIVARRTCAGRFEDVDGNDYLDIALGMGVHFLGHNPPYVVEALARRMEQGFGLGPQCDLTAQAAKGVAALTGAERVSFCNTGSEAVMFALRLARAKTGKSRVALFNGSYHGTFDGVLAASEDGGVGTYSTGTPLGMVEDVLVLDYGTDQALETLEREAHNLAAVLVEPVQSRKPGLQPQNFLRRLRRLTRQKDVCLIFDEMVTGFRIAPGGAQEYFGIRADMALYGKIIGGGLPVGVISGRRAYLDYIDGGFPSADEHLPSESTIVFGGTFCRHPLAMEGVCATVAHLKEQGPDLYRRTNARVRRLADELNFWFQSENVPLRFMHFGPQFIFEGFGPYSAFARPLELDIFYLLLRERGVYTWENRTCGISAVHSEEDLAALVRAVKDSVRALRQGGFAFVLEKGAPVLFNPMSPTQERLFAIFQRANGQAPYHLPLAWRIEGDLDEEQLEIALGECVKRHEALRAGFVHLGEHLLQKVCTEVPFALERGEADLDTPVEELLHGFIRPFVLDEPPLLRAALIRQGETRLFLLDLLHITGDGASMGILLDDLNSLMQGNAPVGQAARFCAVQAGIDAFLDAPPPGQSLSRRQDDARFWIEKLQDIAPLDLPLDFTAMAGTPTGRQQWFRMEEDDLAAVKAACKNYSVTLNMYLNGVFVLLLHKLCRQERLCVGMAHGGRFTEESGRCFGMFVNTVPQDFSVSPAMTLPEFFNGVRASCIESLSRPHAPYSDITLALGRPPARTMLSYEQASDRRPRWPGLSITPLSPPGHGAMYDFALDIVEMDGVLHCNLISSEALRPETAHAWGDCFAHLAREAAERRQARVRDLCAMPPEEERRIEAELTVLYPQDQSGPLELFAQSVRLYPERTALVCDRESLTYARLEAQSDALTRHLRALGAGPEDIVGLLLPRTAAYVVALLGIMRSGAAFLPLSSDSPPERLRFQCEDARVKLVISEPSLFYLFRQAFPEKEQTAPADKEGGDDPAHARPSPLLLDCGLLRQAPPEQLPVPDPPPPPAPHHLAYVLYTSGSTGKPKGVMIEHLALANLCRWFIRHYGLSSGDRCTAFAPFIFDASLWELLPPLLVGAELHVLPENIRRDMQALHSYLRDKKIQHCYLLSQVSELLDTKSLPALRRLLSGGETIHKSVPAGPYLHENSYGPTEFTITSHFFALDGTSPVPIGKGVDNTQSLILDPDKNLCPVGVPGELCLSGPQLARGYLGRTDLTARSFTQNPRPPLGADGKPLPRFERMYRTGDLCRLLPDGNIEFLGRMDRQCKIRGQRLEPAEIESCLLGHPLLRQCLVLPLADARGDKELCAYAVGPDLGAQAAKGLEDELRALAAAGLPPHMAPRWYVFLDALPVTASGKLDPSALPPPTGGGRSEKIVNPPQSNEERILARIWAEQLPGVRIGRDDNFFALGGDSIKALMLTSRIRALGYALDASDFFQKSSLADLALRMRSLESPKQDGQAQRTAGAAYSAPRGAAFPKEEVDPALRPAGTDLFALAPPELDAADRALLEQRHGDALELVLPLAPLQEGMLLHSRLQETSDAYIEQSRLRIEGHLDQTRLRDRLARILARHEAMRTGIAHRGLSLPCQVVFKHPPDPDAVLTREDLSGLEPAAREDRILHIMKELRRSGFDLERPPLLRLTLLPCGRDLHELVCTVHHCIMDGWSMGVFFRELLGDALENEGTPAPFSAHMRRLLARDAGAALAWWKEELASLEEISRPPGWMPAPPETRGPDPVQARHDLTLDHSLQEALTRTAAACQVTLNTLLQCAWGVLLAKAMRHPDVVFAEVLSGRIADLPGMENLVGLCANTVPLRLRCQPDLPFSTLLRQVKERARAVAAHDFLAPAQIQKLSPLGRDTLTHLFAFENYPPARSNGTRTVSLVEHHSRTDFDFTLVWQCRPKLSGFFLYNGAAFAEWQISSMAGAYLGLLADIAARPEALIGDLRLCREEEARRIIVQGNAEAIHYPETTVPDLFRVAARKRPGHTALRFAGQGMSYEELDARSDALARRLRSLGLLPGDRVGLLLPRGFDFPVSLLAVMKSGGVFVPFAPGTPADRLRFQLEDAAPLALISQPGLAPPDALPPGLLLLHPGDAHEEDARNDAPPARTLTKAPPLPCADDPAYIIYTSGSTGLPKGVLVGHRAIANHTFWYGDMLGLSADSVHGAYAPFAFDVCLAELLPPLIRGGTVCLFSEEERGKLSSIAALVRREGITDLWLPPHMLELYCRAYSLKGLRTLGSGGDILHPLKALEDYGDCRIINNYGPTECTITSASCQAAPGAWPTNIGHPPANCPVYVLDEKLRPVPHGFPGELHIGGVQIALGYHNRPDLTETVFVPDPFAALAPLCCRAGLMYKSGDLCRRLPDGSLEFLGRADGQIKLRGHRIETAEIEKALLRHESVEQAVVTLREDIPGSPFLCAYVASGPARLDEDALRAFAARWLPVWMLPARIVLLDALPLGVSGKVDKQALPAPETAARAFRPPASERERALIEELEDVLQRKGIGLSDDFFALGGDSVKAIMIVARLERRGWKLDLKSLYGNAAFAELAARLAPLAAEPPTNGQRPGDFLPEASRPRRVPEDAPWIDPLLEAKDEARIRALFAPYAVEHIFRLSPLQEAMLLAREQAPDAAAYLVHNLAELEGPLDPVRLEQRLDLLCARHEALRAAFVHEGCARPWQVILAGRTCPVLFDDLSALAEDKREAAVVRARLGVSTPDLARDPLLQLRVFRFGPNRHRLLLSWHHMLLDGWSLAQFIEELLAEEEPSGPAVPFHEQAARLAGHDADAGREWWRAALAGAEEASALPRTPRQEDPQDFFSPEAADNFRCSFTLGDESTARMRALSASRGLSPANILQAALALVFARYSGREDQVFASLVSGRDEHSAGPAPALGPYINTVALRARCAQEISFADLAGQVQSFALEARPHSFCSLADIRAVSGLDLGSPLFVMENQPTHSAGQKPRLTPLESASYTGLGCVVEWQANRCTLHVDARRFSRESAQGLARHYHRLLERALVDPLVPCVELPILDAGEEALVLAVSEARALDLPEGSSAPPPVTRLFIEAAARHPDRIALDDGATRLCYRELEELTRRLAGKLVLEGAGPEERVGLFAPRGADYVCAALAVLRGGAAFVPLDPSLPAARLRFMAQDAALRLILCPRTLLAKARRCFPAPGKILDLETLARAPERKGKNENRTPVALPEPLPGSAAYVIYTSGSTGQPKGVLLEHAGLANLCLWQARHFPLGHKDVCTQYAPVSFDASIYEIFPALACGAALIFPPEDIRADSALLADFFRKHSVSAAFLPPLAGKALLEEDPLPSLRILTLAGDKPGRLAPHMRENGPPLTLLNAYGPTEFTVCATAWTVNRAESAPPIGRPVAGSQCLVLDPKGRVQPFGVAGEICLAGIQTARCYLNQPEQSAAAFVPNPHAGGRADFARLYRTGDMGLYTPDGNLHFIGRRDTQIKLRGQRLESGEIESVLLAHPAVKEAVARLSNSRSTALLAAYVVAKSPGQGLEEELRAYLAERLPAWMLPQAFVFIDALPLTANGKVDTAALPPPMIRAVAGQNRAVVHGKDHPADVRGREEAALLTAQKAWAEVLGFEPEPTDHFLELGGDSIKAMQVASRLRAAGFDASTHLVFSCGTLENLAAALIRAMVDKDRVSAPLAPADPPPVTGAENPALATPPPATEATAPDGPDAAEEALVRARLAGRDIEDIFGLTPMQEGLLYQCLLHPQTPNYIEQSMLIVEAETPGAAVPGEETLERNFAGAISRHQALRTVFAWRGLSRPRQIALREAGAAVRRCDFSHCGEAEQQKRLLALQAEERALFAGPEVLEQGPLMRLCLCRLGPGRTALITSFHHIILDGWSMGLLLPEILASAPSAKTPPYPAPRFSVHAHARQSRRSPERMAAQRAYWREVLSGVQGVFLPGRRGESAPRGEARADLPLDAALADRVSALARTARVTVASVLQGAFALLLCRYTRMDDVCFGLVHAGRDAQDAAETVGLFVNTLPRRVFCPPERSVAELLVAVEQGTRAAEAHSDLSLNEMFHAGGYAGQADTCIRQLFVMENLPPATVPSGLRLGSAGGFNSTPHELSLVCGQDAGAGGQARLFGSLRYDASILEADMVKGMARQFHALLRQMADAPDSPCANLRLLDADEEARVLAAGYGPARSFENTHDLAELFTQSATRYAERCALVQAGKRVSYRELDERSAVFAQRLADLGAGPSSLAAILLQPGADYIAAMLGALRCGAAYLPLDPAWPTARIADILEDASPLALISEKNLLPKAGSHAGACLHTDGPGLPGLRKASSGYVPQTLPGQTAYVVYTSGSTGRPKGVLVPRAALVDFCLWHKEYYQVREIDRSALMFSFAFDASAWGMYPLLLAGGEAHIVPDHLRADAAGFRAYCEENSITLANIPTVLCEIFQTLPAPPTLRLLAAGGDALRLFIPRPYALYNEYGPSEATIMSTCHRVERVGQPIPIGRPLAGIHCHVLDPAGALQPFYAPGELAISGPNLAIGYLNRPEQEAAAFVPNPFAGLNEAKANPGGGAYSRLYRTGDLCRMLPDGVIQFMGRVDEQANVAGQRIEPGEIEAHILSCPGVAAAAVLPRPDAAGDTRLAAFVVPAAKTDTAGEDSMIKSLRARLAETLPAGMLPRVWHVLESLPLTTNGKLDKQALPDTAAIPGQSHSPPRSAMETALLELWRELLPERDIGIDDDFFALGGDSLKAARLAARLETMLGKNPGAAALMRGGSIRSLAALLEEEKTPEERAAPLRLRQGDGTTLVLVPAVGGSLLCYKDLLEALPAGCPVWCLPPLLAEDETGTAGGAGANGKSELKNAGTDGKPAAETELARMMRPYVEPLIKTFPSGDFVLLGLCMAGLSAWELAAQLLVRGVSARGLISLNTRSHLLIDDQGRPLPPKDIPESVPEDALELGFATQCGYEGGENPEREKLRDFLRRQIFAWGHYQPEPLPLPMLCLRPKEPVAENYLPFETRPLGWQALALGGSREILCPGNHFSMNKAPLARHVAKVVLKMLRGDALAPDQGMISSSSGEMEVPLTAIQRWFLDLPINHSHFFQSVLLRSKRAIEPRRLNRILEALVRRHEMLRAVFPAHPEGRRQIVLAEARFGLHLCAANTLDAELAQVSRRLDIAQGPLFHCFTAPETSENKGAAQGCRLALLAHHLVVDGVSWRILQRDFNAALGILEAEEAAGRPAPDGQSLAALLPSALVASEGSFSLWAGRINDLARGKGTDSLLRDELPWWQTMLENAPVPLASLMGGAPGKGTRRKANLRSMDASLPQKVTAALLGPCRRLGVGMQELLLTALVRAAHARCGAKGLLLLLEGHGRPDIFADCNPAAIVGWFTTVYPLRLDWKPELTQNTADIRRRLESVPQKGAGYGLLRHLSGRDEVARRLVPPHADILFNYLGDAGGSDADGGLDILRLGSDSDVAPDFPQEAALAFTAHVREGILGMRLEWDQEELDEQWARAFLRACEDQLRKMARADALPAARI